MNKNEKGFSFVEILVVLVIVGLIGAVGWLVYGRQSSEPNNTTSASNATTATKTTALKGELSFVKTGEPTGWSEEHQQGSSIYTLNNDQLGCYASAGVDKPKMDLSNVQPAADAANREVVLGSGQKVTIYESGQSKDYYESNGYIVEDTFDVVVTVACKDKTNDSTADLALKGIHLE